MNLSASNAHITVSYTQPLEWENEENWLYIIELCQPGNPQIIPHSNQVDRQNRGEK